MRMRHRWASFAHDGTGSSTDYHLQLLVGSTGNLATTCRGGHCGSIDTVLWDPAAWYFRLGRVSLQAAWPMASSLQ